MEVEGEMKKSCLFPAKSPLNVVKTVTFFRKSSFELKAEIAEGAPLLPLTPKELGSFRIEVPEQAEPKKVKVWARLSLHGIFTIEQAQMLEEEEYEEIVKEKRELPPDPEEEEQEAPPPPPPPPADNDAEMKPTEGDEAESKEEGAENPQESETNGNGENGEKAEGENGAGKKKEKVKKEPKFEWVEVKKVKKRTKRTDLKITKSGCPGLSDDTIQKLMDQETAIQADMRDIIETDERRNDLEGYILNMRSKIEQGNELGDYISTADRDTFSSELTKAEDWMYDTFDATKSQYIEKLGELKKTGDAVAWRCKEAGMRAEWIQVTQRTISNYRQAAQNPGDRFDHIAAEKLANILAACDECDKWLNDTKEKQEALPKYERPVLLCADMEQRGQDLSKMADEILKEPRPVPPKEEKKEEPPLEEKAADEEKKDAEMEEAKEEEPATNGNGDDMDVD